MVQEDMMHIFENNAFHPKAERKLFSDIKDPKPRKCFRSAAIKAADKALEYELTVITASLYMEYAKIGNRTNFESPYLKRRDALYSLLAGYIYADSEKKEAYASKALDISWAICEETSWVLPAHNVSDGYIHEGVPLPNTFDHDIPEVDLFSASTGALLSMVCHFMKSDLDRISGGAVTKRIEFEVKRRILEAFAQREMRWAYANSINNWVPWIVSNILTCTLILEKETQKMLATLTRCRALLNRFTAEYGDDCGCNEGTMYWGMAIGTLFDACEQIYDLSGGEIDVMEHDFLKKSCQFIMDMCIDPQKRIFVNFADCMPRIGPENDVNCILRMGRRTKNEKLIAFGKELEKSSSGAIANGRDSVYRHIKTLFDVETDGGEDYRNDVALYPDLEVAVMRHGCYTVAAKGGHNGESHNHNDVGSFAAYIDNEPELIDPGRLEYSKDTFNQNRYTLWVNRSIYHNIPEICESEQKNGKQYHSDSFKYDGTLKIDYASAYPIKIEKCTREISIGDDGITIFDDVKADGDCVFHFMAKSKPRISGNVAELDNFKMEFSSDDISVDEIPISSSSMQKAAWQTDTLYRISVRASSLKTKISRRKK